MDLNECRHEIDEINHKIIELLAKRFELSAKVAQIKKKQGLSIVDKNRELEMYQQLENLAIQQGVPSKLVRKIFDLIVAQAYQQQEDILKS
jgi:chorismate mutase